MKFDKSRSNSVGMMTDIVKKSNEELKGDTKLMLSVDVIDPAPYNSQTFNMRKIEQLAKGIKEEGFAGAIEVYPKEDGRYEIIAGHRRFEAAKKVGMKTIPCIVSAKIDEQTRKKRFLGSNIRNREMTPFDWANAIEFYKADIYPKENKKGRFRDIAAEYFGLSPATIYRYECIKRTIPELQMLADDINFPYNSFEKICTLEEKQQLVLLDKLNDFIEFKKNYEAKHDDEDENETASITGIKIKQMINSIKRDEEIKEKALKNGNMDSLKQTKKENTDEKLNQDSQNNNYEIEKLIQPVQDDNKNDIVIEPGIDIPYYADKEIMVYVERIMGILNAENEIENKESIANALNMIIDKLV